MQVRLLGMVLETSAITVSLWSSWRATQLESKVFDALCKLEGTRLERQRDDERRLHLPDTPTYEHAMETVIRVLKGWQEDAAGLGEKRNWAWMIDGDRDAYGYDPGGEPASVWASLRLFLERGDPGEIEKNEQFELNCLSFRFWPISDK